MTIKTFSIFVIVVILLTSCQSSNQKEERSRQNTTKDSTTQSSEHHESGIQVSLNNGTKWEANPETTEGIHKMQKLVNDYLANTNGGNVGQLAENLEKEFSLILENCTMKGEAHEQLHNYLLPLKNTIEKLKDNPGVAEVKQIQSYLLEYERYFN